MIINKPNPQDFRVICVQYILQAIDLMHRSEYECGLEYSIDEDDLYDHWHIRQGVLGLIPYSAGLSAW